MATTTPGEILAGNIAAARGRRRIQQADLAARMSALGWKWVRQTVGEVENGRRRVTADELIGLSHALETEASNLLLPAPGEDRLARLPGGRLVMLPLQAAGGGGMSGSVRWDGNVPVFQRVEPSSPDPVPGPDGRLPYALRGADLWPVVAAIVTSAHGVLVGRRNDGTPPWTFIAGEVEAGESAEDAAVREVKEETGLEVEVGALIGERVHPATGRTMIYMAASPTHGTDAFVGDEAELAEVRWVSLAEADELLPGMYGPVREHLEREIGSNR